MTNLLNVEGREYTAAIDAAKQFGYTKDYLLLLIKDGKIDGQKVGNKWYVHVPSVGQFFAEAKVRKEERRKRISIERKKELKSHTRVRFTGNQRTAVLETLAIVVIGLSLGVTGYVGTTVQQTAYVGEGAVNFIERFAVSLYSLIYSDDERLSTSESVAPAGLGSSEQKEKSGGEGVVVVPATDMTAETAESIRNSFSDPVEVSVDPEHPDTGIIIPKFKQGDGEAYRFLMVPIADNE